MASALTNRFHVVGLARREHGASGQSESGSDMATLAGVVVRLLDVREWERASSVGHSFAVNELCYVAITCPSRVEKLVFVDALYDYTDEDLALLSASRCRETRQHTAPSSR